MRTILGAALAATLASPAALANRADFDLSFGTDGVVRLPLLEQSSLVDLAVQPDGRIVAVGYAEQGGVRQWAVVRFNSDGSLDSSFGTNGVTLLAAPQAGSALAAVPRNVAVNSTGHILVAGQTALMRLTPQGQLDLSYGTGGTYVPPLAPDQGGPLLLDLVPSGDGGFYLGGALSMVWVPLPTYATRNVMVIKLTDAGLIDTSFATNGVAYVPPVLTRFFAEASAVLPVGGAIYLGGAEQNRQNQDAAGTAYKLGSDGTFDPSFGSAALSGSLRLFSEYWFNSSYVSALARQSSGALLAAGKIGGFMGNYFGIRRILADGTTDAAFTPVRIETTVAIDYAIRPAPQLLVDTDDHIVASGFGADAASLLGLLPDGAIDPDFGSNGLAAMPFGGSQTRQLARQADGKYLVIGGGESGGAGGAMYIARLRGTALIPPELVATPAAGGSFSVTGGTPGQSQLLGTIDFANRGGDPLVVASCTASAGFSVGGTFPLTIATGASQSVPVSCTMPVTPLTAQTGTLTCSGINDTDEPSISYSLSCTSGAAAVTTPVPAAGRGALALLAAALALLGLGAFRRRRPLA
ncbi:delta-60 repeat domain-containing protein [Tahibacter harae]|uniref:Delta-60 repeat domain-containing protein n=1 Tax=Tahibacter harae TaxID=2963937 RepID=A0ABT1QWN1_9GAMM|nr:delta-60 repeat domain-containing protein [Tahibacter harae]MCQ4166697.1 delta-60 repeat domain-containing protein [Tahibacter harae]